MKNIVLAAAAAISVVSAGNVFIQVPEGVEMEWKITGPVNCSGETEDGQKGNIDADCQLTPGSYTVKCMDSYGDGWHGGFIKIDGQKYCEDFKSGHKKVV